MQDHKEDLFSPSFSTYSSDRLSEIAIKVSDQYNRDSRLNDDEVEEDDDFEFSLVRDDPEDSVDEVALIDGGIRPIFPIFNRDLLDADVSKSIDNSSSTLRLPLKKMFVGESEATSCSSSEDDESESIPPGKYCVWRPKMVESSPCRWKKSSSTGSVPKRWSFLNFLRRSNSDGKDSLVFLTPKNRGGKSGNGEKVDNSKARRNSADAVPVAGKVKLKGVSGAGGDKTSAHEIFYVQNRAMKEEYKRKSYLPYRQDLVGFFAIGALGPAGKSFPPF